MSRVGSNPITVPEEVQISIEGSHITITGKRGALEHDLPDTITVRIQDSTLLVERCDDLRFTKALHGLTRSLLANMVTGVSKGYRKELEIVGTGYRAQAQGNDKIELQLGFSHPVKVQAPEGITFEVPDQTSIHVLGIDKQAVGQVAADIRALRKPEPYRGKGIKYVGEQIIRKAGKAAK
ncbi:MAG: 50S ribosomal protein L6 [Acidimicrobiia bacterium]|nr:50S ribosomal protein L6 [Acidimicrobiia bacterium]MYC58320.1 50S ribosomal protein L6 [Acidimicrobiia bacterium]MYG93495.1 50S ribosomal protein L6 [Acidimicrobiia bacterium]MYI29973.1 50S ribosomal protein L6 [Acidimicrobiia bacterium]